MAIFPGGGADVGPAAGRRGVAGRPTIGFLAPMVHGFYWGSLLAGVLDTATSRGGRVIAIQAVDAGLRLDGFPDKPGSLSPARPAWDHLDAVVVAQRAVDDRFLRDFARTGRPVVGICRDITGFACPTLLADNQGGVTAVIDHLIGHGHTRIAFVSREPADVDDDVRLATYRAVMTARGLRPREPVVIRWRLDGPSQLDTLARQLLAGDRPPTAVVACTDMAAFAVVKALAAVGVSVPRDVAVVGFDDVEDAATFRPPLSSVAQSFTLTGSMACGLALDALDGRPAAAAYHYTPVTLVTRESCGCRRDGADEAPAVTPSSRARASRFVPALAEIIGSEGRLTDSQRRRLTSAGEQIVALITSPAAAPATDTAGRIGVIAEQLRPLLGKVSHLLRIADAIRDLAATEAPPPGTDAAAAGSRADRLAYDLMRALIERHLQQSRGRPTVFQYFETQRQYYVISTDLLRRHSRESRSLDWLADTEARAGCFALWADGDGPAETRTLRIVGTYHETGEPPTADGECEVREFPPARFVDLLDHHPGDLLYLLSVRFDGSDWGYLALAGQFDVQEEPTFERYNHWAVLLTVALDQEQAMRSERALLDEIRNSEERYALAAEAANDGLWDWNVRSGTVYYSSRWKALLGYADGEISPTIGEWFDRLHPADRQAVERAVAEHRDGRTTTLELEYRLRDADGSYHWMSTHGRSMCDGSGRTIRMIGSMTDITDRKLLEERLRHDALYDALTGLPNRTLFLDRLGQRIEYSRRRPGTAFAVVFIDLNGFKVINDSLGHQIGDKMLVETGRRLVGATRTCDTVARFGGDEFVLLLNDVTDAAATSTSVRRILSALSLPMTLDGRILTVGSAAGIAVSTTGYPSVEEFLRDADAAMYRAKALGNGAVVLFDESMHAAATARIRLELDLRRAVADDQFELFYQPIVRLDGRRVVGAEALIRWRHPVRGLVAPDEFLPVAETAGLMREIGRWTVRSACGQLRAWSTGAGLPDDFAVSVNLSDRQFWDPDLCSYVRQALADFAVPSSRLVIEVTEGVILHNHDQARDTMGRLRDSGVRVHLDDFGTGYASLATLQNFPVDAFKIDKSFTARTMHDARSRELVRIMLAMGRTFGVEVVAEGVETEEEAALLAGLGCPLAQGYLFSRPVPAAELPRLSD